MIAIDMNMPKNCIECRFGQSECGFCHAATANFVGYVYQSEDEGRPDWCPLIPISETHYKDGVLCAMFPHVKWRKKYETRKSEKESF